MRRIVLTLKPEGTCPFHVGAIQYVPDESFENGFTLIFLHAMNLHKEIFEPMLRHLLKQTSGIQIREAWCIENPNQGQSSRLNQKLLSTPKYRGHWTAAEYSRAVHTFLTSNVHGIDFATRKLIGLAHSGAAPSLLLIQDETPQIMFHGFVFLDPAILPSGKVSSRILCDLFGNWAKSKRHTWDSRATALKQLSTTAFKRWEPLGVQLFENALHPSADGSSVTLACSPMQEAAYYMSPQADLIERPFEIFTQLTAADELPIHLIVCPNDEYKGKTSEMKHTQIALVNNMTKGSVQIIEGGHMVSLYRTVGHSVKDNEQFPQTEPVLCSKAIVQVLEKLQFGAGARL
ncbi:Alpha/beta hydrolase family-domain-containing protein [Mycena pura]|uniref:Alpha/beta hydrolase family-domain-containing protein n=1 Tax=Mycena pura TaxID=153505 RepID=A0AAD6VLJ7_9AGAR|nr:Alpha/beta hydrolase family-domain-containing protein [Mycena pura]